MIDLSVSRLHSQLIAAGIPVVSVASKDGTLTIEYEPYATEQQRQQGEAIRIAYDPTPNEGEKLDGLSLPSRVQAAIALRLSASWADLSAARKARVQAMLDNAGAKVLALLT